MMCCLAGPYGGPKQAQCAWFASIRSHARRPPTRAAWRGLTCCACAVRAARAQVHRWVFEQLGVVPEPARATREQLLATEALQHQQHMQLEQPQQQLPGDVHAPDAAMAAAAPAAVPALTPQQRQHQQQQQPHVPPAPDAGAAPPPATAPQEQQPQADAAAAAPPPQQPPVQQQPQQQPQQQQQQQQQEEDGTKPDVPPVAYESVLTVRAALVSKWQARFAQAAVSLASLQDAQKPPAPLGKGVLAGSQAVRRSNNGNNSGGGGGGAGAAEERSPNSQTRGTRGKGFARWQAVRVSRARSCPLTTSVSDKSAS